MIRTGQQYRDSIRDGCQVWINGERVKDVTVHLMFRPLVDVRARIYDTQHDPRFAHALSYCSEAGEVCAVALKLPRTQADWHAKREAVEAVLNEIGGVVTRVGDETVGEMWSLFDGQDILDEVDPAFSENVRQHVDRVVRLDPFHVSANTDPKGDRSKRPQEQDPDMLLHVVKETDAGIVVRGAKFETAAAYANQAFVKPTIANWGDAELSDYAVGFICDLGAPNLKFICRTGFAGRAAAEDYPLANRFDEIDTLVIFDDVLIPWENVLFYRHTKAASFIRATLHRYRAYAFVLRSLKVADMMIGAALFNARQTGLDKQQAVQEKLAMLACYREGINAHLTAAIAMAEVSPGGLLRRPSAHLPAIRPVAALCEPRRGLPEFRLGRTAPLRAQIRWPLGAGAQRHRAGAARRHRQVTSPARLPAVMRRFSRAQCREDLLLTTGDEASPVRPSRAKPRCGRCLARDLLQKIRFTLCRIGFD